MRHAKPTSVQRMLRRSRVHSRGTMVGMRCTHEEMQHGADTEQHRRMAVHAVLEPLPAREREVLVHGQRVDIAEPAMLEVAGGSVVHRVGLLPVVIRRQRDDAEDRAHDVRRAGRPEERPMSAVVLEDEQPDQEKRGRHREQQGEPIPDPQTHVHQRPRTGEQHRRTHQLPDAAFDVRVLVGRQTRTPVRAHGLDRCSCGVQTSTILREVLGNPAPRSARRRARAS